MSRPERVENAEFQSGGLAIRPIAMASELISR
jgi:hypothetical protein